MDVSALRIGSLGLLASFLLVAPAFAGPPLDPDALRALKQTQSHVDPRLLALARAPAAQRSAVARLLGSAGSGPLVALDVASSDPASLRAAMTAMGVTRISRSGNLSSARVPVEGLAQLLATPGLRVARPALAVRRAGRVQSQGDAALGADRARLRAAPGGGQGIRVGVLSDSFRCNPPAAVPGAPTTTAAQDFASGELPADYIVLDNGSCEGAADEGRAMAQLVLDVAPRSTGAFRTAMNGEADFAAGILALATQAGADVIVDDVAYFAEPMFQDGAIAQAASAVTRMGVPYFSAAGNEGRESYEDDFRPVDVKGGYRVHDFDPGPGVDMLQSVTLRAGADGFAQVTPSFQWDEANFSVSGGAGSPSDLDMVFLDADGELLPDCFTDMDPARYPDTQGFPPVCQFGSTVNTGQDAIELPSVVSFVGDQQVQVMLLQVAGPAPTRVKYVPFVQAGGGLDIDEYATHSGTVVGHANAAGVIAVGAAPFSTTAAFGDPDFRGACLPACAEPFSSAGGVEIRLDPAGRRLAIPENRSKPDVTGPDGTNTTFFGADSVIDDDDLPNFFGTSAAAPHVAAVAALLLGASESAPVAANDGSLQRMCVGARRTLLLPRARASALLRAAQGSPVVRAGFCLTPAGVEAALESSALDMTRRALDRRAGTFTDLPDAAGPDADTGAGFVDAEAAVRQVAPAPLPQD